MFGGLFRIARTDVKTGHSFYSRRGKLLILLDGKGLFFTAFGAAHASFAGNKKPRQLKGLAGFDRWLRE